MSWSSVHCQWSVSHNPVWVDSWMNAFTVVNWLNWSSSPLQWFVRTWNPTVLPFDLLGLLYCFESVWNDVIFGKRLIKTNKKNLSIWNWICVLTWGTIRNLKFFMVYDHQHMQMMMIYIIINTRIHTSWITTMHHQHTLKYWIWLIDVVKLVYYIRLYFSLQLCSKRTEK